MGESTSSPYDINGQHFNPDMYLHKLLKDCSLEQVMDQQGEIIRDTQALHSDMQTLVYENYNKFISATDTIRKMKSDFKKMEDEMDLLAANMESITSFSEQISCTLQDTRQQITKLSGVHSLLKRLQFLFKLPGKLKVTLQEGHYSQAVQDYIHAQRVLHQYGNMASFQGIQSDCETIVEELKQKLRDQFKSKEASAKELAESVDLLLQLQEPADSLCAEFLAHAETHLCEQLTLLEGLQDQDIIEFVDIGSSGFLSDLCLVVASYNDMFINRPHLHDIQQCDELDSVALSQLGNFVLRNMQHYFNLVGKRVEREQEGGAGDTLVLVRALDRFHRRLQAMNTLFSDTDFARTGTEIVLRAGCRQCHFHLQTLKAHFTDTLTQVRHSLAAPKLISQDGDSSSGLSELLTSLVLATVEKVKGVLQDLLSFCHPDLTFGLKPLFREVFCVDNVREDLVVGFLHYLTATARGFCDSGDSKSPPALLLLLSKMCLEFETSSVHYLLSQTDEWFNIDDRHGSGILTSDVEICTSMRAAAQGLLNHYVRMQGLGVSQMLRKSVETRDWLHTIEPRTVRAVMKRVVEDIAAVDSQVGALYEEGQRAERSSDSSRRTHSASVSRHIYRSNWSSYAPSQLDSSLVTNIQKLFSERIEIFSSVEFSKVSILTGIIKISLKTFLECVRLRTFSRYGLQQIQVDTHYLQLYLWRFVADENLVHFLLDEILGSAVHRCLDPVLMEPSVVEIICERG
ncbi:vacuolar protein sorting-associated protein 51 homolog isoform X1 [Zootermopsis nevadensis]|uniref:Vacuolar protein sorting-associated protein 51 homolog n=1 Tax=Zootermopsis nevadensis TaxID=136037 RepID=A0A067QJH8_ZOONE|nr:vacuolar protein sorting-associated protein 51 homolog isoform X1 [Zootermopsis nevadensis]KDR09124.1 Fat-free-like protein [Zootermopsis nevadensis]